MPFLLDILFTVLSHGIGSSFVPDLMFNHASAQQHPWEWSLIHGAAVLAACVGVVVFWKNTEDEQSRSARADPAARRGRDRPAPVHLRAPGQPGPAQPEPALPAARAAQRSGGQGARPGRAGRPVPARPPGHPDPPQRREPAGALRRGVAADLARAGAAGDVVRAAIAEIEDLDRVDDRVDESLRSSGRSVADLTHLFAELLENAVHFSPPGHVVVSAAGRTVLGRHPPGDDRGLGRRDDGAGVGRGQRDPARDPRTSTCRSRSGSVCTWWPGSPSGTGSGRADPTPGGGVTASRRCLRRLRAVGRAGRCGRGAPAGTRRTQGRARTSAGVARDRAGFRTPPAGIPGQRGNGSLTGTPANGTAINGSTAAPLNGDARPAGLSSGPSALDAGPRPPAGSGAIDAGPRPAAGFDPIDAGARPPAASGAIDAGPRPAAGPGAMDAGARPAGLDSRAGRARRRSRSAGRAQFEPGRGRGDAAGAAVAGPAGTAAAGGSGTGAAAARSGRGARPLPPEHRGPAPSLPHRRPPPAVPHRHARTGVPGGHRRAGPPARPGRQQRAGAAGPPGGHRRAGIQGTLARNQACRPTPADPACRPTPADPACRPTARERPHRARPGSTVARWRRPTADRRARPGPGPRRRPWSGGSPATAPPRAQPGTATPDGPPRPRLPRAATAPPSPATATPSARATTRTTAGRAGGLPVRGAVQRSGCGWHVDRLYDRRIAALDQPTSSRIQRGVLRQRAHEGTPGRGDPLAAGVGRIDSAGRAFRPVPHSLLLRRTRGRACGAARSGRPRRS